MRISDWSSDVCSSDLALRRTPACRGRAAEIDHQAHAGPLQRPARRARLAPPSRRAGTPARGWPGGHRGGARPLRSEEHTSELQSLMRISYAVFCLKNNIERTNVVRFES